MDPAWVAVIGTAVGSAGATGAAFVAAWAGRRQASLQAASQQDQWRRQLRRDTYGALLNAGAEARDELGHLFAAIRRRPQAKDLEWLVARLEATKPLVNAVRLATAAVFVEGPPSMLEPAKRVEEGLVLFHTAMTAVATRSARAGGETFAAYLATCGRHRVGVRTALMDFASAARAVLDGGDGQASSAEAPQNDPSHAHHERTSTEGPAEDLTWAIDAIAKAMGVQRADLDADMTLWENGLDSLLALRLAYAFRKEHGLAIEESWFFRTGEQTLRQVAGHIAALQASGSSEAP